MEKRILVLLPVREEHRELLENAAPQARITFCRPAELTGQIAASAQGVIGNIDPKFLPDMAALEWLQLNSAGADAYLKPGVLPAGTVLTNATGAYGLAIGEYLVGMLLALYKKLPLYRDQQFEGRWENRGQVRSIFGARVLIVGLGDIGSEFARRLRPFGATLIGVRRHEGPCPAYVDEIHTVGELDRLLPQADVVALCLPGTAETRGLLDRRRLSLLRRDAVLLNVGRGNAVDLDALCELLERGELWGAGLDVTDPEPLPAGHPIWRQERALITPHVSGGYQLPETFERIVRIAAENLRRFCNGEELLNQVDFSTGYRRKI
ncbi:D-2-hydroxyacid dehydrogenase [Feifania hominis]|uniref:D-2-hydroxyacid dehydrogenase n=1 Tax=Feifania hominis TaxID=2763660 RepID=UPI00201601E9